MFSRLRRLARVAMRGEPQAAPGREGIQERLRQILPADAVIVEAGGHKGEDTVWLSRFWNRGHVHVFEPVPRLFSELRAKFKHRRNVSLYPFALSDSTEAATLHISSGGSTGSSSILEPRDHLSDHPEVLFKSGVLVPTIPLDMWAQQYGIDRIHMLWLDLQGCEFRALQGASRILSSVLAIHIEVYFKESYAGVSLYPEVAEWLKAHGFRADQQDFQYRDAGDVLFCR